MIDLETVPEITLDELFPSGVGVSPDVRLVDVRSPSEFEQDHVPGSISVPLFDDQERAVVGTLYRHAGPESARAWGEKRVTARLDLFTEQLLEALALRGDAGNRGIQRRVVLCARGGQRSRAVVHLIRSLGYPVERLEGGYRAFRTYVRAQIETLVVPVPIVLHGLTGVGKTRILREVARRRPGSVLDLEGLAGHRSSVLGAVGLKPVSQKRFESGLCGTIRRLTGPWTLVEWEARRLGDREIPAALHRALGTGHSILITADRRQRVRQLVDDYVTTPVEEGADLAEIVRQLHEGVKALRRFPRIGESGVDQLCRWLDDGQFEAVAAFLLDEHYDARYRHAQDALTVEATFEFTTAPRIASSILEWIDATLLAKRGQRISDR